MAAITIQVLRLSRSVITDAGVALAAGLAPRWSLTAGRALGLAGTLYDTFDWKLYGKGMTLVGQAGELQLRKLSDGSLVASARAAAIPGFAADLPIGSLRKSLGSVARERALLPRTRPRIQVQCHRILNEDAKTIAQAYLHSTTEHAHCGDAEARCEVMLQSLRGYETESGHAAAALVAAGWTETSLEQVYLEIMRSAGLEPGGYSSTLAIHLDPGMRSDAALRVILRELLQIARANAPYITADIDLEFVHDYRVALRRMRAALGEMRQVFTAEETTKFRRDLAAIARSTNALRDLDVYLRAKDGYTASLPRDLRKDIAPLFELLSAKRSAALEDLKSFVDSPVPDQILGGLDAFLSASSQGADAGPDAHRPIGEFAREIIHRRNKRLIKHGRRIHRDSPDALVHQLRIDGKRLRYLMEFFSTLFDARLLRRLLKRLKRLQDILGEFNDGAVQQAYLWARAEELSASRPEAQRTLLAVGSLISHLDAQQQSARSAFERAFAEYSAPENQRSFRELLNTTEK